MATPKLVKWHSEHLCWSMGVPMEDKEPAYSKGEKEIQPESLADAYCWIKAGLFGVLPKGRVIGFGASDDKAEGRNCVYVEFRFPIPGGIHAIRSFFTEDMLTGKGKATKTTRRKRA